MTNQHAPKLLQAWNDRSVPSEIARTDAMELIQAYVELVKTNAILVKALDDVPELVNHAREYDKAMRDGVQRKEDFHWGRITALQDNIHAVRERVAAA